jgi:cell division GTPase FtsZ
MANDPTSKLKFHLVEDMLGAKIRVVGIGGGGGNALNRMIEAGIEGVDFIADLAGAQVGGDRRADGRRHDDRRDQ